MTANVDKGVAAATMDLTDYIGKAIGQLIIKDHYCQLSKDKTAANNETVNNIIERFQRENVINKNVLAKRLRGTLLWTTRFYIQPKIHEQGNTGRLVISSIICHTLNVSKYVNYHPQPIVQQTPCYIQDTSDFLRKIKAMETIPDNSYLVSQVVRSL